MNETLEVIGNVVETKIENNENIIESSENTEKIKKDGRLSNPQLFRKGISGNPAGKPKGVKHFNTLFNELLKEKMTMKINGQPVEMTYLRAMGLAMVNKAIKGSEHAFDSVADRVDGKAHQGISVDFVEPPKPILIIKSRMKQNAILGNNGNK
jgi:hypothetical protein